jgi:hypothetical protein
VATQLKLVPPQVPAVHLSLAVQRLASLHDVPSARLVQELVELAGVQTSQALPGFTVPAE